MKYYFDWKNNIAQRSQSLNTVDFLSDAKVDGSEVLNAPNNDHVHADSDNLTNNQYLGNKEDRFVSENEQCVQYKKTKQNSECILNCCKMCCVAQTNRCSVTDHQ